MARTDAPGAGYRPVADLLRDYLQRDPDRTALVDVDYDRCISYGELAPLVDSVAAVLVGLDVGPGTRVLLLAQTSIEKVVVWLALWRIGAVVCPLDLPFLRASAVEVIAAIRPQLILCERAGDGLDILADCTTRIVGVSQWEAGMTGAALAGDDIVFNGTTVAADVVFPPCASLFDVACMACTSGTTGTPKIVVYDHLCYWENGLDSIEMLALTEADRTLEYRSLGWFSAQILSLMPFLQTGLALHLARRFSRTHFPQWIARYRISVSVGVPAVIVMLANEPSPQLASLASLRIMTCSTSPLAVGHATRFEQLYGLCPSNLYGSSETGWMAGNRPGTQKSGTVGRAAAHVRLDILSESGQPCAPGVPGRLSVTADKLAPGYLQADGSIKAIRGAPLLMQDMAMIDADAFVHVLGRGDNLINRGGIKIAPAEIEEVLLTHPAVREAAVIGMHDPVYGQHPACFVVLQPGGTVAAATLIAHCAHYLPREKMPAHIFIIAALPRSARGKLLVDELAASGHSDSADSD